MPRLTRKQKNKIDQLSASAATEPSPLDIAEQLNLSSADVAEYLGYKKTTREKKSQSSPLLQFQFDDQLSLWQVFLNFLKKNRGKIVLILISGFFVYSSSLPNTFVSDDLPLLKSPYLTDPLKQLRDEPVSAVINSATYALNYAINGTTPLGYHLVNVLLHLGVSLLIFFFLTLILETPLAFVTSLIFTIHPLHAEAVAWVSGRHYLLYSFFVVLALVFYLFSQKNRAKTFYYGGTLLLFITAVYSFPEQAIVFPLFLPLIDFCLGNWQKNRRRYLPFFLLAGLFALLSYSRVLSRVESLGLTLQPFQKSGAGFLVSDVVALGTYFKLYLLPWGLSFYHEDLSTSILLLLPTAAGLLFSTFVLLKLALKRSRLFGLALGFILISLLPTLTPLKVSWIVAERYTYLALLGPALLTAYLFFTFYNREKYKKLSLYLLLMAVMGYSFVTLIRGLDWKDEDSLWLATAAASPTSSKAWNNMGDYYGRHNDPQKSLEAFQRATELNPSYADAWHNAGNVLLQTGKIDESIPYFEKSLQFNPNLIEAYNNLALVYFRKGDPATSAQMIEKSLSINPNAAKTYALKAALEYETGNLQAALSSLQKALALDPQNQTYHQNLQILQNQIREKTK